MKVIKSLVLLLACVFAVSAHSNIALADENHSHSDNMAVWFEIPVSDMTRAMAFYEAVFQLHLEFNADAQMAFFPGAEHSVNGALIKLDGVNPGADGTIVYLNGGADLQVVLDRVTGAGGQILVAKTQIPGVGFFAIFKDSEGNRLGLFSAN